MTTNEVGHEAYRARHWASAYVGYIAGLLLVAFAYGTDPFGLQERGLEAVVAIGFPLLMPLVAMLIFRGRYRLVALGLTLAAPTLWLSFGVFIFIGGSIFW